MYWLLPPADRRGKTRQQSIKLGEDAACGTEALLTDGMFNALGTRGEVIFDRLTQDEMRFQRYRANQLG